MPRKAQPVPPIYQPEVCAEAVCWAAHQRHREVFVGWPTLRAIWLQREVVGQAVQAACCPAWDAQMDDGASDPNQPNDLYEPVAGHQAAHGQFDEPAPSISWELQLILGASWLARLDCEALHAVVGRLLLRERIRPKLEMDDLARGALAGLHVKRGARADTRP
jgi:hypothetical protein